MAALLLEVKTAAEATRAKDKKKVSKKIPAGYLARYDAIAGEAVAAGPAPAGRNQGNNRGRGLQPRSCLWYEEGSHLPLRHRSSGRLREQFGGVRSPDGG